MPRATPTIRARDVTRAAVLAALLASPIGAQANPYTDSLLQTARALSHAVPGPLPVAVGYFSAQNDTFPISAAIAGAPHTSIPFVTPVFQVRYNRGWIMVDAGMDRAAAAADGGGPFDDARYAKIQAALRGAGLIVITHEHSDHVGTLSRSAIADQLAPKTMLTRRQVATMLTAQFDQQPLIDSAMAQRYLVVDYDRVLPIAPGVVLIRTPGHTPGAQMVLVTLANRKEVLLAGDVAWLKAGVDGERQKPDSTIRFMHEDRTAIAQQLAWLKHVVEPAGVVVVISHDGAQLDRLAQSGVLVGALDLSEPR
jgi:glyoxylase-like metal-dependent hydrolase (beta-lactamase superfamily II)